MGGVWERCWKWSRKEGWLWRTDFRSEVAVFVRRTSRIEVGWPGVSILSEGLFIGNFRHFRVWIRKKFLSHPSGVRIWRNNYHTSCLTRLSPRYGGLSWERAWSEGEKIFEVKLNEVRENVRRKNILNPKKALHFRNTPSPSLLPSHSSFPSNRRHDQRLSQELRRT